MVRDRQTGLAEDPGNERKRRRYLACAGARSRNSDCSLLWSRPPVLDEASRWADAGALSRSISDANATGAFDYDLPGHLRWVYGSLLGSHVDAARDVGGPTHHT